LIYKKKCPTVMLMGYVFDSQDAGLHEGWLARPENRRFLDLEKALVGGFVQGLPGRRLLEIGCGSGWFLEHFLGMGLSVSGIDPSPQMLDRARTRLRGRADLHLGYGEDLPFDDNSFDIAVLVTALEFVSDPAKVLAEAARVAKDRVVIGFLNRYALKGIERRIKSAFSPDIFSHAHFFSLWEIKDLVRQVLGSVPMQWKSSGHLPAIAGRVSQALEIPPLSGSPFGTFIALEAQCVPRFRATPLKLREKAAKANGLVIQTRSASKARSYHGSAFV